MKRYLQTALFDLDGTVLDTEADYSVFWGTVGKKYHPEIEDFEKIIKGTTLTQIFDRYFPDRTVRCQITTELDSMEMNMNYRFINGAENFIKSLRDNGVKCAVVTSSNEKKIQAVRTSIPNFDSLFDKVFTSEMFIASKPSPDCYLLGATYFSTPIANCVVFEDAFTGLQAGTNAGMYTVGLCTTNERSSIIDKCHYVIDDFTELSFDKINELLNAQ